MRYFFHVRTKRGLIQDAEGTPIADRAGVASEAAAIAIELAREFATSEEDDRPRRIEVWDAGGLPVHEELVAIL